MTPIFSENLEKAVLGCLIQGGKEAVYRAVNCNVDAEHFYTSKYARLFNTIIEMTVNGINIDRALLMEYYLKSNQDGIESFELIEIDKHVGSWNSIEHYCLLLKEDYLRRKLGRICEVTIDKATRKDNDIIETLETLSREVENIYGGLHFNKIQSIGEIAQEEIKRLESNEPSGLLYPFEELNNMTGGLQKGEILVIATPPSVGKTAMAQTMVKHWKDKSQYYVSLEMAARQLFIRQLTMEKHIHPTIIRRGGYYDGSGNWVKINLEPIRDFAKQIEAQKFYINDKPQTIFQFATQFNNQNRIYHFDIGYIDYGQLIKGSGGKNRTRENELSEVSHVIREVAQETGIPIIVLLQLNRKIFTEKGHEPNMSFLRETGAWEQDADLIFFIDRPFYWLNKEDKRLKRLTDNDIEEDVLGMLVKNRLGGEIGDVELKYFRRYGLFADRKESNRIYQPVHYYNEPIEPEEENEPPF
jgi:replicative DNA helicase